MEDYSTGTNLIENNIFQHVTAPLSHNGANTGSVFGYNFAIDDNYTGGGGSPGWMIPGVLYHEVGIVPWPATGPDVTTGTETGGHAHRIPARLCFDNTEHQRHSQLQRRHLLRNRRGLNADRADESQKFSD